MALPVMTPEQRASALARAAVVRKERAALKGRLKRGELTLADALKDASTAKMKVSALVEALPGMGKIRAAELMGRLGIAANRRAGGLGPRQRAALETALAPAP